LQVINSSPGELQPVFEAILERAHTHRGATRGTLDLFDGETFRPVAMRGLSQDFAEQLRPGISVRQASLWAPLLAGVPFVHIDDLRLIDDPVARGATERGARTSLALALRKDGALLGLISCNRGEVRPFSGKEIGFLENFAAQAVIAMDNARLLGELRERTRELEESLEYQTATSDVLKVISRSTFDLQPILDTLVETGQRLCDSNAATLSIREGDVFRYVATRSLDRPGTPSCGRGLFRPAAKHWSARSPLPGRSCTSRTSRRTPTITSPKRRRSAKGELFSACHYCVTVRWSACSAWGADG
jgi:transcriptional regulator with GAF, ATPase, and Fis domain